MSDSLFGDIGDPAAILEARGYKRVEMYGRVGLEHPTDRAWIRPEQYAEELARLEGTAPVADSVAVLEQRGWKVKTIGSLNYLVHPDTGHYYGTPKAELIIAALTAPDKWHLPPADLTPEPEPPKRKGRKMPKEPEAEPVETPKSLPKGGSGTAPPKGENAPKKKPIMRGELDVMRRIDKLLLSLDDAARARAVRWIQEVHGAPALCRAVPVGAPAEVAP